VLFVKDSRDYGKDKKEKEENKENMGFEVIVSVPMNEIKSETDILLERI
jgi:hypothetical protein